MRALAEEIELQRLPDVKETILDIDVIMKNVHEVNIIRPSHAVMGVHAGVDILGRYFIPIPQDKVQYDNLRVLLINGVRLVDPVLEEPRDYRTITAVQVLWSKIDKHQNIATHWMVDTESRGEDHVVRGR